MRAFLFVFDPSPFPREAVIRRIDHITAIENWYAMFGNTMVLASKTDSAALSSLIRSACPDLTFIVSEIDPAAKAGWLPEAVWSFLNDPRPAAAEYA